MADEVKDPNGVNLQGISDSVIAENLKTNGGMSAAMSALIMRGAVAAQDRREAAATDHDLAMRQVAQAVTGKVVDTVLSTDAREATAESKVLDSNAKTSEKLADLDAVVIGLQSKLDNVFAALETRLANVVALAQQMMKGSQTTPPETGRE